MRSVKNRCRSFGVVAILTHRRSTLCMDFSHVFRKPFRRLCSNLILYIIVVLKCEFGSFIVICFTEMPFINRPQVSLAAKNAS